MRRIQTIKLDPACIFELTTIAMQARLEAAWKATRAKKIKEADLLRALAKLHQSLEDFFASAEMDPRALAKEDA